MSVLPQVTFSWTLNIQSCIFIMQKLNDSPVWKAGKTGVFFFLIVDNIVSSSVLYTYAPKSRV